VADVSVYDRYAHLDGEAGRSWRSGIKHDQARVMELVERGGKWENGFGEVVSLEPDYLYPLLKSSDLHNYDRSRPARRMLVTQRAPGEDTTEIGHRAPLTWQYLNRHAGLLDARSSSVYRNRPRFSMFGVGPYSFSPWKVAVSGLYKSLRFRGLGPGCGKPVVFDDTCYFLPCRDATEAGGVAEMLNSEIADAFFHSLVFWDAKRPVTASILRRMDLRALAAELNMGNGIARGVFLVCDQGVP